jgi:xylose dehydrogenase (NAD/NADP)
METALAQYFDGLTRRDWQTLNPEAVEEPIRIAVVGLGWFAREWALPGIEQSAFTTATVGVDIDSEAVETVCEDHNLTGLTPAEFHDGAAVDQYDAVYVATPNATHLDYVETAASQGKAILCEKPLEATVDRARELVATAEEAGTPLMVGYRMQTDPLLRRARELVQSGAIGDVVQVHATMTQTMLGELGEATDQWRLSQDLSGGCALMDIGIYPINTTRFVLDSDPVRAFGHTRSGREAFSEVDEHVAFQLTFPDGVNALCTASQGAHHHSRFEVTGTEGQVVLDPAFYEREDRELTVKRGGVVGELDSDQPHQLEEEFAYFGHQLLADEPFRPDGEHALTDMRILAAIYDSADTDRPVAIENTDN